LLGTKLQTSIRCRAVAGAPRAWPVQAAHELAKHGGDESPLTFWQVSCPNSLLRKPALRILSGKAAALEVERLWSAARITLTINRCSILTSRQMQLLKCKHNVFLEKPCMKLLEDDPESQSIFNDLLQFEEHARLRLAQQGKEQQGGEDEDALVVAEDEEFDVFVG
jgi:hypothetical protein